MRSRARRSFSSRVRPIVSSTRAARKRSPSAGMRRSSCIPARGTTWRSTIPRGSRPRSRGASGRLEEAGGVGAARFADVALALAGLEPQEVHLHEAIDAVGEGGIDVEAEEACAAHVAEVGVLLVEDWDREAKAPELLLQRAQVGGVVDARHELRELRF